MGQVGLSKTKILILKIQVFHFNSHFKRCFQIVFFYFKTTAIAAFGKPLTEINSMIVKS